MSRPEPDELVWTLTATNVLPEVVEHWGLDDDGWTIEYFRDGRWHLADLELRLVCRRGWGTADADQVWPPKS